MDTDLVADALHKSVQAAVGNELAKPRGGQTDLCKRIATAIQRRTTIASEAPTGSGKTFAYLVPAMLAAAEDEERTVVSTGSLALQAQIVSKDAPVVAAVVEELTGIRPAVAVLKGWSNYGCVLAAMGDSARTLAESAAAAADPLAKWVLTEALEGGTGDRDSVPFPVDDEAWEAVSVRPQECVGKKCQWHAEACRPAEARRAVAEADVVITNHALVAVQANTAAPIVFGNQTLGDFEHLVVDEAHNLPSSVRNQGQVSMYGARLVSLAKHVQGMMPRLETVVSVAKHLGDDLDRHLSGKEPPDPEILVPIDAWVRGLIRQARPEMELAGYSSKVKWRKLVARLEGLSDSIDVLSEKRDDYAYWLDDKRWKASPVNVGGMLVGNVYRRREGDPISVSLVSATLPQGVVADAGVFSPVQRHPSPFGDAYAKSLLYVPLDAPLTRRGERWTLDLDKHQEWAAQEIVALVTANRGSALVLATSSSSGRRYAEAIRSAAPEVRVLSQWDGGSSHQIVGAWKDDHRSVLVGTRGLMTGVDAPGATCSLVVIDRVPRAPQNAVDQARSALIVKRGDYDRWAADRLVYVTDAALLLEQAAGRLIRSTQDQGVVAVLDPRLSKECPARYPEPTRRMLLGALSLFSRRTKDRQEVLNRLKSSACADDPSSARQVVGAAARLSS